MNAGNPSTLSEAELVRSLKDRDQQAFSHLYKKYSGALYSVNLNILGDETSAGEVLQEVFINSWRSIDVFDEHKCTLFTWLLNSSRHLALETLKSKSYAENRKSDELRESIQLHSNSKSAAVKMDEVGLKKVFFRLKGEHRIFIDLFYFQGYTLDEISVIEEMPLSTVKSGIRMALIQLREYLK
jgi:RNA polymerase sigma factor (sigma-70 family)